MKNLFLVAFAFLTIKTSFGQYNIPAWPSYTVSNNTQAGYIGIGTKSTMTQTNTPLPNFNLHLNGTADYTEFDKNGLAVNLGKTTRLGFTNTTTGLTANDGVILRMSDNNFAIQNRESGNIFIGVPNVDMVFSNSSSRLWIGTLTNMINTEQARMNIIAPSTDNGLFIQSYGTKYALSLKTMVSTSVAINVRGSDNAINYAVKGNGEVFARKYTTTLGTIPDYVFDPSYKLLPLNELKTYITTNKHLPNIPSAKEYEERGELDLGELNRKLLEKVEELTLYILQLEERTKALENK
ncbi:MAG: hypothetical protein K9G29_08130 [Crocinitomicaceae bacterium]|jgi:hypothetical protein|nr:hypothetical protein [Crocinitomicaceae bacterium]